MKSTAVTAATSTTPGSTGSSDLPLTAMTTSQSTNNNNNNNNNATTTTTPPTLSPTPNGVVVNTTTNHTAPGPSTKGGGGNAGSIDDNNNNTNSNTNSNNHHQHNTPQVASWTEETCSEGAFSRRSSDNGQAYEVIEYDYNDEHISSNNNNMNSGGKPYHHLSGLETDDTSELFAEVVGKTAVITIDDDSPAAAALRANAKIHVSSVGKAARAVQLQSVRRVLKRATGITKSGYKKGKPPRIPPTMLQQPSLSHVVSPGPVDVDQYMDAGEMTDHSNNNNNTQDILIEGVDEDHADDDMGHDTTTMMLTTTCHDDANLTAVLHQHGIDEPSFSEIGGDDDHWMMGTTATAHRMDDRHNSRILATHPTTTAATTTKSSTSLLTSSPPLPLPMHTDRDLLHIPDGVAPGTVEAGKKGR